MHKVSGSGFRARMGKAALPQNSKHQVQAPSTIERAAVHAEICGTAVRSGSADCSCVFTSQCRAKMAQAPVFVEFVQELRLRLLCTHLTEVVHRHLSNSNRVRGHVVVSKQGL